MSNKPTAKKDIAPDIVVTSPWRLIKVSPLADYKLHVEFIDGTQGTVEMKTLIFSNHAGVFAALKDVNLFNQVFLSYGVASWPNEIDLAPDAMYTAIKKNGIWILK